MTTTWMIANAQMEVTFKNAPCYGIVQDDEDKGCKAGHCMESKHCCSQDKLQWQLLLFLLLK